MAINQQDENQIYPIHTMNYLWLAVYRMWFSKASFIFKVSSSTSQKKGDEINTISTLNMYRIKKLALFFWPGLNLCLVTLRNLMSQNPKVKGILLFLVLYIIILFEAFDVSCFHHWNKNDWKSCSFLSGINSTHSP